MIFSSDWAKSVNSKSVLIYNQVIINLYIYILIKVTNP